MAPFEPIERAAHVSPETLNNTNRMRLHVFANDARGHVLLMAIYDNLGKGASGAAVQNLNLMIGAEETLGTDLPKPPEDQTPCRSSKRSPVSPRR